MSDEGGGAADPPAPGRAGPTSVYSLTSEAEYRLDFTRLVIVFSVMLAVLLEIIDTSIINVAVPTMMGNLGATLDEIDWVVTSYIVAIVIMLPLTGWMSNRFGRKRYFVTSILIFTAASAMCGASQTIDALIFWRVVQGLGGGALMATAQAILVESFPPSKQGVGQAIFGVGAMIGPALGPTLGGWLTDNYSWHWCFLINVPLGLLAATLCAANIEDPPHLVRNPHGRVDWPGITFLVVGIGCLQTLLERGNKKDWFDSAEIVLLAVATAVGLIGLVWRETTTDDPVVDFRVLLHRDFAVGCTFTALGGLALYGVIFLMPVYTQTLLGWTAWQSGLSSLPSSITTALVMAVLGNLIWRVGPRGPFVAGMVLMLFTLWVMSRLTLASGWNEVLFIQGLRGMASGMLFVPLSAATLRSLPPTEVAKGAGLYNLFRQLGGSFGIATLASILDRRSDLHEAELARHLSPVDSGTVAGLERLIDGFTDRGLDPEAAALAARHALDRMLEAQAMMEAFYDAFAFIAVLFLVLFPLAILMPREMPGKTPPAD
ncbi:MAG: DHA2 family efflux MFS transporter permease subunit [Deltaproteobacteria bacterium]|nr:DHA2 family efflux MFS transporter permease subunit [Deltaproteobacteria bacterium]